MIATMDTAYFSTGETARQLGVTQTRLRMLCESGLIEATSTPGGQWRIAQDEVEKLKRDGLPAVPRPLPGPGEDSPSPAAHFRRRNNSGVLLADPSENAIDAAEQVLVLENGVRAVKLRREIETEFDWFREREERESARQQEREEAERERQSQHETETLRRNWEAEFIEYAFDSVPKDAPQSIRLDVHDSVESTLARIDPSRPVAITRQLVDAAVDRALAPWRLATRMAKVIKDACEDFSLPYDMRRDPTWKTRMFEAARGAIAKLQDCASDAEMQAVTKQAIVPLLREFEHGQGCERIISYLRRNLQGEEKDEAIAAVEEALSALPVGAPASRLEKAKESALAPFGVRAVEREEAARRQRQERAKRFAAEFLVDLNLGYVGEYLDKEYEYPRGYAGVLERRKDAERIRAEIRETLVKACMENAPMSAEGLKRRIEKLVGSAL